MLAVIDSDNNLLARAAWHEAGHVIAAMYFKLPLREVLIRENGTGLTSYARWLGRAEVERWVTTTFAGPEAERDAFGDEFVAEATDLRAISSAINQQRLFDWAPLRLGELRHDARRLVERNRGRVALVADALIRHRHLSAEEVRAYGPDPS
jgi:hypothetical protein